MLVRTKSRSSSRRLEKSADHPIVGGVENGGNGMESWIMEDWGEYVDGADGNGGGNEGDDTRDYGGDINAV